MNFISPFTNGDAFRFEGMDIVITQDCPRMQLSERVKEVLSPECIAETNAWMLDFFGVDNVMQDGHAFVANGKVYMNRRTFTQLHNSIYHQPTAEVFNLADYRR